MHNLSNEQKAYLAGLIDGEGCISVTLDSYKVKGKWIHFSRKVYISNTNLELLKKVQKITGIGTISLSTKSQKNKLYHNNWKSVYNWAIYGKGIKIFLPEILPYLIAKKRQAELLLEFQQMTKGQGYGSFLTPELKERRIEITKEMKQLNKRGL